MTIEELEKRIQAVEDMEEIKKLHREYIFLLSDKKYEQMVDCFAPEATVRINSPEMVKGTEQIRKHFLDVVAKRGGPKGGQILVSPVITVEGEKAKGHWTMFRFFGDFRMPDIPECGYLQGRYDCEYEKIDGKWKFSSMTYLPWPEPDVKGA
jgi:hypothetical protein